MTRTDIDRLFLLLRELYPRIYPSLGQNVKLAWLTVLEPFDYDDVKEKLLVWNRGPKGRNFPDPRECIPEKDYNPTRREQAEWTDEDDLENKIYLFRQLHRRGPGWAEIYPVEEFEQTLRFYQASQPENRRLQDLVRQGREVLRNVEREEDAA